VTGQEKADYGRQYASWAERARKAKGRITHVTWRNGAMDCVITPGKEPPPPAAPEFVSRRGLLL
jgi:hypothetical protein